MKQKDIALIAVIAIVSGVISFLVSGYVFAKPADRELTAEKVDVITSEFSLPSSTYFNAESINPTQLIEIGESDNPNPFATGQ
jgi:hypothetical protein